MNTAIAAKPRKCHLYLAEGCHFYMALTKILLDNNSYVNPLSRSGRTSLAERGMSGTVLGCQEC